MFLKKKKEGEKSKEVACMNFAHAFVIMNGHMDVCRDICVCVRVLERERPRV